VWEFGDRKDEKSFAPLESSLSSSAPPNNTGAHEATAVFRKPQRGFEEAKPPTLTFASIEPAVGGTWTSNEGLEKYARKLRANKSLDDSDEGNLSNVVNHFCIPDLFDEVVRFWNPDDIHKSKDGEQAVAEPVLDVTVRNVSDDPVVITDVGFEVVMAGIKHITAGEPSVPYELGVFKSYQLSFPKLFSNRHKVWNFRKDPKTVFVKCKNPIVIPPKQLMRYTLQIKDFVWANVPEDMLPPNHAVIRLLVVAGDAGVARSETIYLNTWE
jgi:hypothetical protein